MQWNNTHIEINLAKIRHNALVVTNICRQANLVVAGVVKGTGASPQVAQAMIEGGVQWLADSRLSNLKKLREAGINVPLLLLRLPALGEVDQVVQLADISVNSELVTIGALATAAKARGVEHQIILMVDVGDLREGVWPQDVVSVAEEIASLDGVQLVGLGTNVGCYGGLLPTRENTEILTNLAQQIRERTGLKLPYVSGGNTRTTIMLESQEMPAGIHHLRIGEGILLGNYSLPDRLIPSTYQDTFTLHAPVIEIKEKPSVPLGTIAQDAFGKVRDYDDHGIRRRAIVAVGRQDLGLGEPSPLDPTVRLIGASSDHLIVDVTDRVETTEIGTMISFQLDYPSVLALMTSSYIPKRYI